MARRQRGKVVRGRRSMGAQREETASGVSGLVDYVARGLVDEPSSVHVTEVERHDAVVFELRVAMGDLGKVIGKSGRTAQAMRTLLSLSNTSEERDLVLDIVD